MNKTLSVFRAEISERFLMAMSALAAQEHHPGAGPAGAGTNDPRPERRAGGSFLEWRGLLALRTNAADGPHVRRDAGQFSRAQLDRGRRTRADRRRRGRGA